MPKAEKSSRLNRAARRVAASAPLPVVTKEKPAEDNEPSAPETENQSRGQRKRQAKRDKYLQREQKILSTLKLKSQDEQKRRIDGLDAIRDALMNTTKGGSKGSQKEEHEKHYNTNKSKLSLVGEEVQHMSLVLQHPAFKANPFETLQEHLRNTLAEERKQLELQAKERSQEEKLKQEEQKRQKKERLQGVKKKSKKKYKAARSKS
jgi:hypothetical protein